MLSIRRLSGSANTGVMKFLGPHEIRPHPALISRNRSGPAYRIDNKPGSPTVNRWPPSWRLLYAPSMPAMPFHSMKMCTWVHIYVYIVIVMLACRLSRFYRESHNFSASLTVSRPHKLISQALHLAV